MDRLYENYTSEHAGSEDTGSLARILERDLLRYIPHTGARCLDLGCGQGGLPAYLRGKGFVQSFGIDISPEQVQGAHALGRDFVKLGPGDDYLRMKSAEWDVVTAFDFLEHLERMDVLPILVAVRESLSPNGLVVVRVPNGAGPLVGRYQFGDFTHLSAFTGRSLQQLAVAAGFSRVEVAEVRPVVHGVKSAARRAIWSGFSGATKLALAAESGQVRGHLVTSNIMAYLHT
jgi:2-polyprenyl-3-methyl-5-hydroxy-6-metoxy-1,4-benzoquinol methylase